MIHIVRIEIMELVLLIIQHIFIYFIVCIYIYIYINHYNNM